jgi:hypothetical protein
LPNNYFVEFCDNLSKELLILGKRLDEKRILHVDRILSEMGFPKDWYKIAQLRK